MLDRSKRVQLGMAALCFALFGLLTLGVTQDWAWLVDLDDRGQSAREWAIDDAGLRHFLRGVEIAFSALWIGAYSLVLAILLLVAQPPARGGVRRAGDGGVVRRVPGAQGARRPRPPRLAGASSPTTARGPSPPATPR